MDFICTKKKVYMGDPGLFDLENCLKEKGGEEVEKRLSMNKCCKSKKSPKDQGYQECQMWKCRVNKVCDKKTKGQKDELICGSDGVLYQGLCDFKVAQCKEPDSSKLTKVKLKDCCSREDYKHDKRCKKSKDKDKDKKSKDKSKKSS